MTQAKRDLVGYGRTPPEAKWPKDARIAVNFCLNYEEGAERHIDHGDGQSESILHEVGGDPRIGDRDLNSESMYEYGSRAGFWRVMRCLEDRGLNFTINAVGQALTLNPDAAQAIADSGADIRQTVAEIERLTGRAPVGWYTGRPSLNTRRLVIEQGGFLYDSDSYADDLPYWCYDYGRPHLILPYSIDTNDSRFFRTSGFVTGEDFFQYNRDAFDVLYAEGGRMLTIGLHARLIGRPGRIGGLMRLLDHMMAKDDVWIARREDIARHWIATHPPKAER
jgi:allantoinase